jgi:GNAT superfamily N-acetyltransferase
MAPSLTLARFRYSPVADELAALRWSAYVRDGKRQADSAPSDFVDAWDPRSEVVVARLGEELVGSVRVTPCVTIAEIKTVHGFEGDVPVIEESGLGEASRLCVAPRHRGQGLFWILAAEMIFLARDLGIGNLFSASTDALWPNWRQCGFRYLGVSYSFASLNSSIHRLMLMDVDAAVTGRHASDEFRSLLSLGSRCTTNGGSRSSTPVCDFTA